MDEVLLYALTSSTPGEMHHTGRWKVYLFFLLVSSFLLFVWFGVLDLGGGGEDLTLSFAVLNATHKGAGFSCTSRHTMPVSPFQDYLFKFCILEWELSNYFLINFFICHWDRTVVI